MGYWVFRYIHETKKILLPVGNRQDKDQSRIRKYIFMITKKFFENNILASGGALYVISTEINSMTECHVIGYMAYRQKLYKIC